MESEVNNLAYFALAVSVISTIVASISAFLSYRAMKIMKSQFELQSTQAVVSNIKDILEFLDKNHITKKKVDS